MKRLKQALVERGLAKSVARACTASCLDLCEFGVAIVVEPIHVVYGRVTLDDVEAIADAMVRGEVVERLLMPRPEARA